MACRLISGILKGFSSLKYLDGYPAWKRQSSFHVFEGVGHQDDLVYPTKDVLDFVFK